MLRTGRENEGIIVTNGAIGKGKDVAMVIVRMAEVPYGHKISKIRHKYPKDPDYYLINFSWPNKVSVDNKHSDITVREIITTDYPHPFGVRFKKTGHYILEILNSALDINTFEKAADEVDQFMRRPFIERVLDRYQAVKGWVNDSLAIALLR
ncbi:MAG: hypothetical protein Q7R97_05430 [Candidatus Daviesbacteria bacterium]|nr:hypothetical protein [Candidatus Daviesbacteria bacterium]